MIIQDIMLIVLVGLLIGILSVTNKKLSISNTNPLQLLAIRGILSLSLILMVMYLYKKDSNSKLSSNLTKQDIYYSLLFVILTLLISWILLKLMKNNSSSNITLLCAASGLSFAILLGSLILNEKYSMNEFTGFGIFILGILIMAYKPFK